MIDPAVDPRLCHREILQLHICPFHQPAHTLRQDIDDLHDTVDQPRYDHPQYSGHNSEEYRQCYDRTYALCNRKCLRKLPSTPCQHPINVSHRKVIYRTQQICHHQSVYKRSKDPHNESRQFLHGSKSIYSKKNQNAAEDDQECCQPPFYIFFFQIEFHTFTSTPIYYNNSLVKSCPFLFLVYFLFFSCLRVEFMHILCIIITCYKFLFITCL